MSSNATAEARLLGGKRGVVPAIGGRFAESGQKRAVSPGVVGLFDRCGGGRESGVRASRDLFTKEKVLAAKKMRPVVRAEARGTDFAFLGNGQRGAVLDAKLRKEGLHPFLVDRGERKGGRGRLRGKEVEEIPAFVFVKGGESPLSPKEKYTPIIFTSGWEEKARPRGEQSTEGGLSPRKDSRSLVVEGFQEKRGIAEKKRPLPSLS